MNIDVVSWASLFHIKPFPLVLFILWGSAGLFREVRFATFIDGISGKWVLRLREIVWDAPTVPGMSLFLYSINRKGIYILLHGCRVHTIFIHEAGTFHERSREALRPSEWVESDAEWIKIVCTRYPCNKRFSTCKK